MNDTIKVNIKKFFNNKYFEIISILIYKIVLDFIFVVFMKTENNNYYFPEVNMWKWFISSIIVVLLYKIINKVNEDIIRFFIKILYLFMFIPISTVYMGRNFSTICYLTMLFQILCIIFTVKCITYFIIKKKEKRRKKRINFKINYEITTKIIYYAFIINTIIVLTIMIYYNGWPTLKGFDFYKVYEIREQFYLPKVANYLYTFEKSFILPFLLVLFINKKKYKELIVTIIIQLLFYLIKADKVVLLSIFLSIGIYLVSYYKKNITEKIIPITLVILCVVSILTFEYSRMIFAVFITRLLIIPANLKFFHFDFFGTNPKIGLVGTVLNAILKFENPYELMPYPNQIAGIYLNDYNMYSGTGMLAEGYARFGYIGLIIIPIIMAIVLYIINYGTKRNSIEFILGISIFPIMLLNEGYLLPSLMFGGILLLLCVCVFFVADELDKKREQDKEEVRNVVMLLDNAFDPDIRVYKEAKYLIKNGYNIEIICLDKKNKYKSKPIDIKDNIKIKRIFCRTEKTTNLIEKNNIIKKVKQFIYLFWLCKFIVQAKKYLKTKNFKILHCHDLIMAFIGVIFFKDKDIVFDMHEYYGDRNNKFKDFFIKRLTGYIQNKAKWIIYVNDFQKEQCNRKNYQKLVEIPNYPEKSNFMNIEKVKSSKIKLSYIGKVRDFVSLSKLIEASKENNLIQVSIYGDGSEFKRISEYAKTQKKEYIVKGSYNGIEETEEIYRNTNILYAVYNTIGKDANNWNNAMPIKSYEAIITLTPIIASKNTILGNFVEENDIGFTINIDQEKSIENLFRIISENPQMIQEKVENLKKIQYKYTWEDISENLSIIYSGGNNE